MTFQVSPYVLIFQRTTIDIPLSHAIHAEDNVMSLIIKYGKTFWNIYLELFEFDCFFIYKCFMKVLFSTYFHRNYIYFLENITSIIFRFIYMVLVYGIVR